jgi:hypothetical protein
MHLFMFQSMRFFVMMVKRMQLFYQHTTDKEKQRK